MFQAISKLPRRLRLHVGRPEDCHGYGSKFDTPLKLDATNEQ